MVVIVLVEVDQNNQYEIQNSGEKLFGFIVSIECMVCTLKRLLLCNFYCVIHVNFTDPHSLQNIKHLN